MIGNSGNEASSIYKLFSLVLALGGEEGDGRKAASTGRSFAKTEILLHSMAVFSQKGLEHTTVQDLLDAANISRRTFYKYFSSKIDVLESVYELALGIQLARYESELGEASSLDQVEAKLVDIYFDYQVSVGRIIGIMLEESLRSESPLAKRRVEAQKKAVAIVSAEVARVGGLALDPLQIYALIWAMECTTLHFFNHTQGGYEDVEYCRREMRKLCHAVLSAGSR